MSGGYGPQDAAPLPTAIPLHAAVVAGDVALVRELLAAKADVNEEQLKELFLKAL